MIGELFSDAISVCLRQACRIPFLIPDDERQPTEQFFEYIKILALRAPETCDVGYDLKAVQRFYEHYYKYSVLEQTLKPKSIIFPNFLMEYNGETSSFIDYSQISDNVFEQMRSPNYFI